MKGFLRLVIVIVIFTVAYGVINVLTSGGLHRTLTADFSSAAPADPPAVDPLVRVYLNGQIWTCHVTGSTGRDCVLTYGPPARVHS